MPYSSFPFEGQTTTETQYSKLFRELQDSGVVGAISSSPCQVTVKSGAVRTLALAPGYSLLRGHMFNCTAEELISVPAVTTGSRVDRVVLRLDPVANAIDPVLLLGTSTAAPAPNQTDTGVYELPLATIVTQTSGAMTVSDERKYVGHRVGVWSTTTRPSGTGVDAPRRGKIGYNIDLGQYEFWSNASKWEVLGGEDTGWVSCTLSSGFTGTAKVRRKNGQIFGQFNVSYKDRLPTDWINFIRVPNTSYLPPITVRELFAGYNTATPNAMIINVNPGDVQILCARVGSDNTTFRYNGSLWLVD